MAPFADGTPQASQWPIPPGHFFDYEIATEQDDSGTYFYHSHVGMQAMGCAGPLIVDDCDGTSPYYYDDERVFLFQDFFNQTDQQMSAGVTGTPFVWTGETTGILLNGQGVAEGGKTPTAGPVGGFRGFYGGGFSSPAGRAPGFPPGLGSGSRRSGNFGAHMHRHALNDDDDDDDDDASDTDYNTSDASDSDSDSDGDDDDDDDDSDNQGDGGDGTSQPTNKDQCSLPVVDVEPGKTYRFRFIGGTGLSLLSIGFEGHDNLTIVQVDGNEYNAPVSSSHLQMGPGQRFDVVFRTKTAAELEADGNRSTYFIQFETRERPSPYRGYGVLRYHAASAAVPVPPANPVVSLPEQVTGWMEYTFTPLHPVGNAAPTAEEVTRRVTIDATLKQAADGRVMWQLAGLSWTEQSWQTPLLVDIYQRGQAAVPDYAAAVANGGWDPRTQSFPARIGEVLEIVLQNVGSDVGGSGRVETHPFHAHSNHYYDVGSGPGQYDAAANDAKVKRLGYRPVKRDTTMLYRFGNETVAPGQPGGWRAWRIRVTDAGVWMIHCHILGHMMMGMQSVWVIGNAADIIKIPLQEQREGYLTYGGSVYGNDSFPPSVYEYFNSTGSCGSPAPVAVATPVATTMTTQTRRTRWA